MYILDQAVSEFDPKKEEDRASLYMLFLNLGLLSLESGDYDGAVSYAERAIIAEPDNSDAYGIKADVLEEQGNLEQAIIAAELCNAKSMSKQSSSKADVSTKQTEFDANIRLVRLYSKAGKYAKASNALTVVSRLANKLEKTGEALSARANIELFRGDLNAAETDLQNASLELGKPKPDSNFIRPAYTKTLEDLAVVQLRSGNLESAKKTAVTLADTVEQLRIHTMRRMSLSDQLFLVQKHVRKTNDIILTLTLKNPSACKDFYPYVLRWKGLLVQSIREQSKLMRRIELGTAVKNISDSERKLVTGSNGLSQSDRAELLAGLESKERALKQEQSEEDEAPFNLGILSESLTPHEALVDIYRFRDVTATSDAGRYIAFGLAAEGTPLSFDLGDAKELDLLSGKWISEMSQANDTSSTEIPKERKVVSQTKVHTTGGAAEECAAQIFSEFQAKVWTKFKPCIAADKTSILISPDGETAKLPWNVLIAESSQIDYVTTVVDSPRSLMKSRSTPGVTNAAKNILLAGGIDFSDAPSLPKTEIEVKQISDLAHNSGIEPQLLLGKAPTRKEILDSFAKYAFVHLATHGYFAIESTSADNGNSIPVGFKAGRGQSNQCDILPGLASRDPLLVSGILLASTSSDDPGRLNAEELIGVDLSGCELLTLSACETGLGQALTGQGVMGLRAAAAAAGCRTVLMSLWTVDDSSTQVLMQQFYTNLWKQHMSKARALQKAQEYVRSQKGWSLPYFWAGWILSGEGW